MEPMAAAKKLKVRRNRDSAQIFARPGGLLAGVPAPLLSPSDAPPCPSPRPCRHSGSGRPRRRARPGSQPGGKTLPPARIYVNKMSLKDCILKYNSIPLDISVHGINVFLALDHA